MNNFREIDQKGGLAQIKIDNGFIYDPKYDEPVEGYNRYCGGKLYCKTGYMPNGCTKCAEISSNSDDLDDAPPSISTRQMRRDYEHIPRTTMRSNLPLTRRRRRLVNFVIVNEDDIDDDMDSMRTDDISRGGRRQRKTRRQRKSRRQRKTTHKRKSRRTHK